MRLLLDHAALSRFVQVSAARYRDNRAYYVARDRRAIIVCRGEIRLSAQIAGRVADAAIGWDEGRRGFVLEQNEGKRHSKATLYRLLPGSAYDLTLSEFLKGESR